MCIYDYLFYKTYLLAQRSKNFDDIPALGGSVYVIVCLMLNIFTVYIFIEGLGIETGLEFKKEYKYPFSLGLVILVLVYYQYKGRYKKIVEHYETKNRGKVQIHPIIVIILYYGISGILIFLAGMFKNHTWIFAR